MTWEVIGAFLSGVGSVAGAAVAIRAVVHYCDRQCELRMEAYREGLAEGKSKEPS